MTTEMSLRPRWWVWVCGGRTYGFGTEFRGIARARKVVTPSIVHERDEDCSLSRKCALKPFEVPLAVLLRIWALRDSSLRMGALFHSDSLGKVPAEGDVDTPDCGGGCFGQRGVRS